MVRALLKCDMNDRTENQAEGPAEDRRREELLLASPEGWGWMIKFADNDRYQIYPDNMPLFNKVSWGVEPQDVMAGNQKCPTFLDAHPQPFSTSRYVFILPEGTRAFTGRFGMALEPTHPDNRGLFTGRIVLSKDYLPEKDRHVDPHVAWSFRWEGASSDWAQQAIEFAASLPDGTPAGALELQVDSDGDNTSDQAVWIDPKLLIEHGDPEEKEDA